MTGVDVLDREMIMERAEELRFWLLRFNLSQQATGAIQRELGAIIDSLPLGAETRTVYGREERPALARFSAPLHGRSDCAILAL